MLLSILLLKQGIRLGLWRLNYLSYLLLFLLHLLILRSIIHYFRWWTFVMSFGFLILNCSILNPALLLIFEILLMLLNLNLLLYLYISILLFCVFNQWSIYRNILLLQRGCLLMSILLFMNVGWAVDSFPFQFVHFLLWVVVDFKGFLFALLEFILLLSVILDWRLGRLHLLLLIILHSYVFLGFIRLIHFLSSNFYHQICSFLA